MGHLLVMGANTHVSRLSLASGAWYLNLDLEIPLRRALHHLQKMVPSVSGLSLPAESSIPSAGIPRVSTSFVGAVGG